MSDQSGDKQLRVTDTVRAYQRAWIERTRQRVKQGEPFAICNGDDFEEILNVMDIPVIVINYWHAIITMKRMDKYYQNLLSERDYPATVFSMGLATTMDNKPEVAPWGGIAQTLHHHRRGQAGHGDADFGVVGSRIRQRFLAD